MVNDNNGVLLFRFTDYFTKNDGNRDILKIS